MKFKVKAYVLQDIGQRKNQEDAFYPPFIQPCHFDKTDREESYYDGVPHTHDRLFILCDGMGGHERGEVASRLVCDVMSRSLLRDEKEGTPVRGIYVNKAVKEAMKALDENDDPSEIRKLGTTMTLLNLCERGAVIAHIGDSRVYHFRPADENGDARCLFRTEDHSLAYDMLKRGMLTYQQLQNYKGKNVLTRCLMAGMAKYPVADIYSTSDVKAGDIFLLCSDGLLEELYDEDLCTMLTNPDFTDEEKVQVLLSFCEANKDNHTAWLVRIEDVQVTPDDCYDDGPTENVIVRLTNWLKRLFYIV